MVLVGWWHHLLLRQRLIPVPSVCHGTGGLAASSAATAKTDSGAICTARYCIFFLFGIYSAQYRIFPGWSLFVVVLVGWRHHLLLRQKTDSGAIYTHGSC
jgi:hypothetical protein